VTLGDYRFTASIAELLIFGINWVLMSVGLAACGLLYFAVADQSLCDETLSKMLVSLEQFRFGVEYCKFRLFCCFIRGRLWLFLKWLRIRDHFVNCFRKQFHLSVKHRYQLEIGCVYCKHLVRMFFLNLRYRFRVWWIIHRARLSMEFSPSSDITCREPIIPKDKEQ
jgi:hypothetical protein